MTKSVASTRRRGGTFTDGGCALLVTSPERARDLRQPPALIRGVAQASADGQEQMTSFYRDDLAALPETDYELSVFTQPVVQAVVVGTTDIILRPNLTPRQKHLVRLDGTEIQGQVLQQQANLAEARSRLAQAQLNQTPTIVGATCTTGGSASRFWLTCLSQESTV